MSRPRPVLLIVLVVCALIELTAHAAIVAGVPRPADYRAAADALRGQLQPKDLLVAAPAWSDPLLREVLGDRMGLAMAGRSDSAAYERLWALSIRGAVPPEAPARAPDAVQAFGAVRLLRWSLGPSPVRTELVEQLSGAVVRDGKRDCTWQRLGTPRGGGLGRGALPPAERFQCVGPNAPWVAPVVLEDLSLTPRYCVFQNPAAGRPLSVRFDGLALGERLVVHAGLYYEDERMRSGPPVELSVLLDGEPLGALNHHDGDGFVRLELPLPAGRANASLEFVTRSTTGRRRSLCWSASIQSGAPERP